MCPVNLAILVDDVCGGIWNRSMFGIEIIEQPPLADHGLVAVAENGKGELTTEAQRLVLLSILR